MSKISIVSSVVISSGEQFIPKIEVYDKKGVFLFSKTSETFFLRIVDAATEANNMNKKCMADFKVFKDFPLLY